MRMKKGHEEGREESDGNRILGREIRRGRESERGKEGR